MSPRHIVQKGECLSGIAWEHGFTNWRKIYDHPNNAQFRAERPNPDLIYPGDTLFIPEREAKHASLPTGQTKKLKLKGKPSGSRPANEVIGIHGPATVLACCSARYYYSLEFKHDPSKEDKRALTWKFFQGAQELHTQVEAKGDALMLKEVPDTWLGHDIEVRGYLRDPDKEGRLKLKVERSEVCEFIELVQKVEAAFPTWSTARVTDAIRRTAGYDDELFQKLLGRPGKADDLTSAGALTAADLKRLQDLARHSGNGLTHPEKGIGKDCLGYEVALGHVITGVCGGMYRTARVDLMGRLYGVTKITSAGEDIDNLYAVTISGDLGQCGSMINAGKQAGTIGPGTEATHAELVGDIDGFILGSTRASSMTKLSIVLHEYYCAGEAGPASKRFATFSAIGKASLLDESKRFASNYDYVVLGKDWHAIGGPFRSSGKEVEKVYNDFLTWLAVQESAEEKRAKQAEEDLNKFQAK